MDPLTEKIVKEAKKQLKNMYLSGVRYNFQDNPLQPALLLNVFPTGERPRYFEISIKEKL